MLTRSIFQTLAPMITRRGLGYTLAGVLLASCGLQKDIDVELPAYPAQLVVECYLEPNRVPRMSVTESGSYLAEPTPKIPQDVKVVLTLPSGRHDTLDFKPGINLATGKAYTHIGRSRISASPGQTFQLEAYDTQGRRVTGSATMPAIVPIDKVEWKFNDLSGEQRKAYVTTQFRDPGNTVDFYRFQIHKSTVATDPEVEYTIEDRLNNGTNYTLGTSYEFQTNDTLFVTLYHLNQPYFQFLQSVEEARNANGNPFAQPSAVRSTVEGGIGVFTVLSYQRQRIIVR